MGWIFAPGAETAPLPAACRPFLFQILGFVQGMGSPRTGSCRERRCGRTGPPASVARAPSAGPAPPQPPLGSRGRPGDGSRAPGLLATLGGGGGWSAKRASSRQTRGLVFRSTWCTGRRVSAGSFQGGGGFQMAQGFPPLGGRPHTSPIPGSQRRRQPPLCCLGHRWLRV